MLVFKRREALLIVGIPLLVGIIWTLGLTQLVLGRLTVITFAFGAVLIGLGIDFSIHIYNRYLEEYAPESGVSVYRALHTALVRTGEGVLLGALMTAVAFYAMFFTSFRGFREMGFVAGSGILCCLLSVFLLLPILIPFVAPRAKGGTSPRMVNFALPRLYRLVSEYPRLLIIFGLVLTVYFSFHARFVSFEKDIGALKQPSKKYRDLHEQVITEFSLPTHQIIAIVRDDTLQGALEKNDRLYENIMSETRYPVLSCDTLRAFLPSIKTQNDSRRTFLERVGEKMPRLRERMLAEARTAGLSDESLEPFLERLERMVSSSRLQGQYLMYEDLRDPFMIRQVQNYLVKQGRVYKIMTRIFPQPGEWDAGVPADFLADISRGVDSIEFTGSAIVAQEIQRLIRRDLAVIMLLVTVSVFLILLLYFGILHKAVLAMFPVVCGCIWMLGTIRLLNIDLNFLNVVVIPMIIGVGVDNGIHLMQRFYESSHIPTFRDLQMSLVRTGRALVMTSLTTMVGFGSLAFADFRGIREMGLLSIFGISYTLVAALVILTAFLHVWSRRGRFWDIIGRENGEIR